MKNINNKKKNSRTGKSGMPMSTSMVPAAKNVRVDSSPPRITMRDGACRVVGHEQVVTVNGSVSFDVEQYKFNPGLPEFPWLSLQAVGWEKYKVNQLEFVYIPSEAVTTTPGTVYLAFDYDPSDAPPSTLASISTYETQTSGRVFEALECFGRSDRMHDGVQKKKIRQGPVGGDLTLFDACSINVATVSCSGTGAIGQLWVYYDIDFISRQIEPPLRISPSLGVFSNAVKTLTTATPAIVDFDTVIVNGLNITSDGSGTFSIGIGSYVVSGYVRVSDSSAESLGINLKTLVNGVTVGNTAASLFAVPATGSNTQPFSHYVSVSEASTLSIEVTATGAAGTLTTPVGNSMLFIQAV